MERAAKEQQIAELHRTFGEASVVVVAHNKGMTVTDASELRRRMREGGAGFKVAKNTLARRALKDTPYGGIEALFKGPTSIAFSRDPVAAAKVAVDFAKKNDKFVILGGALGARSLDAAGVEALAKMPSLDTLRGTLIGLLQTPAQRIASVLQAPAGQLARVFAAYGKTGADAPAAGA